MSIDDTLGGFVLDPSALAALGGEENIYATTWADRAAVRGIVLLVPAAALSEAWQQIRRHDPGHAEQMRDLLASPMVLIDPLDETEAAHAGSWSTAATSTRMWPPRRWRPAPEPGTGRYWRPRQLACESSTRS